MKLDGGRVGALPAAAVSCVLAGALLIGLLASGPSVVGSATLRISNVLASKVRETVLWSFGGLHGGRVPVAGLIGDRIGALYGTTYYGGAYSGCTFNCGTVFKLTPSGSAYKERVLWSFGNGQDGQNPAAGLISDTAGALYGTTEYGGAYSGCSSNCGTVFKLTPSGSDYTERVLWSFGNGQDGQVPAAGLVGDKVGALYGTTYYGGVYDHGTVFKLTPSGSTYTERVVWSFGNGQDGQKPFAGLIADKAGGLYGTTTSGGAYNCGTVFTLTPSGSVYTERLLWSFANSTQDGCGPTAGLIADRTGVLFGTTETGGAYGLGTAFKVTPSGSSYTESILWNFGNGQDGAYPIAGLLAHTSGVLYGTTNEGGPGGRGTVFKLTPSGTSYMESVLWSFGQGQDGQQPEAGLIAKGRALYGTTEYGGVNTVCGSAGGVGCGTAFKVMIP